MNMNIKEALTRYTLRKKIIAHMKAKKWKLIGEGAFAVVFTSPDKKKVIKVIAPDPDFLWGNYQPAPGPVDQDEPYTYEKQESERLQGAWLKFIDKNKKSPHLPKFFKTKTETVTDRKSKVNIVMYEMEVLTRLPEELEYLAEDLVEAANPYIGATIANREKQLRKVWRRWGIKRKDKPGHPKNEKEFIKKYTPFYNIVFKMVKSMPEMSDLDLHSANMMMRGDTLVITDPWMPAME